MPGKRACVFGRCLEAAMSEKVAARFALTFS
jgi:hypothetical protein